MKGLTSKVLDHHGKRFTVSNVPMELEPLQKPHPPIWYGVHMPDSAERAARRNLNVVSLDPPAETRLSIDRYRAVWPQVARADSAVSQARARPLRRRGADRCRGRWRWRGAPTRSGTRASPTCSAGTAGSQSHPRPATFDLVMERGQGIAGSPQTVAKVLGEQLAHTGCNYMVGQFTFGDLTLAECLRSIGLFADEVMPALRAKSDGGGREGYGNLRIRRSSLSAHARESGHPVSQSTAVPAFAGTSGRSNTLRCGACQRLLSSRAQRFPQGAMA